MSNVFDIKRFGKYISYDLNNAWNNFGLSLIVLALVPLIVFVFQEVFSLAFTQSLTELPVWAKGTALGVTAVALIIIAPVKLYGRLTEKRLGSDWLMVPASAFEKFLSMVLILCVVVPVVFLAISSCCDMLLSLIPCYGESLIFKGADAWNQLVQMIQDNDGLEVTTAGYSMVWLSFCSSILVFTLGAICFKKNKVAKVILCLIAFESVVSLLGMGIVNVFDIDLDTFFDGMTVEKAQHWFNTWLNIGNFIVFGVLLGGIYARIKTLKH